MKETHKYDDIINLEHHVSTKRSHMSIKDRAAQFAPFAALSGHTESVVETEQRVTQYYEQGAGLVRESV